MQSIMVCVTLQNTCEKLIAAAQSLRGPDDALFVLHVAGVGQSLLGGDNDAQTLDYLYSVAQRAQADMTVLHAPDIPEAIAAFAREKAINTLILGAPPHGESELIRTLQTSLNGCRIIVVDKEKRGSHESISDRSGA